MAKFPKALDYLPSPIPNVFTPNAEGITHDQWHNKYAPDLLIAIQKKVGVDDSTDPASLTYQLQNAPVPRFSMENRGDVLISAGQPCASPSSGVGVELAFAGGSDRPSIGLMTADVAPGFAGPVQTDGVLTLDDWTAATGGIVLLPRAVYFLDPLLPGKITSVAPSAAGHIVQYIGRAVAPNTLCLTVSSFLLL